MLTSRSLSGGKRWPRGQKFTLSTAGIGAEEAYRDAVVGARAAGRAALESALAAWAGPRLVAAGDGVILSELSGKRIGLAQLCEALEDAGIARDEVRDGLGRLIDGGLVELLPLGSQLRSP